MPAWEKCSEGNFIVSGATAGIRGGAKFAAFASAKFALRGLAQTLAREYEPRGIFVAHVILDGLNDEPQNTSRFGQFGISVQLLPEAIAQSYLWLVQQGRSACTHELDLRPVNEQS